MTILKLLRWSEDNLSENTDGSTMALDEGNGDGERVRVASDTFDGARRITCFGESGNDILAKIVVGGKVDMFAPSDVVGIDKKRLKNDLIWLFDHIIV